MGGGGGTASYMNLFSGEVVELRLRLVDGAGSSPLGKNINFQFRDTSVMVAGSGVQILDALEQTKCGCWFTTIFVITFSVWVNSKSHTARTSLYGCCTHSHLAHGRSSC